MNSDEKMLDHEYDGIHELDNPLPGWWLATFYGAILFSVVYIGYYHFGPGPSPETELAQDIAELQAQEKRSQPTEAPPTEDALMAIYSDKAKRAEGHAIFTEKCASCHSPEGGGLIGPNLTDNYWIHGKGTMLDLTSVISDGVPEKGMPPWRAMLKKDEVYAVAAFVRSLKGTHPPNPKAPQGEEVKD